MNRSTLTGAIAGAAAVTAVAAIAGYGIVKDRPANKGFVAAITAPREVCTDVVVTHTAPTRDPDRIAGTVAGAVVGGVVGNQIGSGDGKQVATAAGAVAGGVAGNKIQQKMQAGNTYTTTERRCTPARSPG